MKPSIVMLHPQFNVGAVDERIFGGFLEHMGRAVYEGVYEPGHAAADAEGFRTDVLETLDRLKMTAMRYPGGNFASGYHWLDGVGPREKRPTVRELAWQSVEPNHFGTDEYIRLCRRMGWTPMITVNLGTGSPQDARNWVEYCNCPAGTRYADLRTAGGSPQPYGVKLWCLGNEMDGPWQLGHVPAEQYAIRAQQAGMMMKSADRSIELVACGSCTIDLPTFMEWDRVVLEYLGDLANYVSLHRYVGNRTDDTADYLAVGNSIDRQIEQMDAVCRFVQARRRSRQRVYLCFDEWNVWYKNMQMDGEGRFAPHLIEEVYNLEDALVAGEFFHSFLRHADVLKIANLAQIVNVIAPVLAGPGGVLIQSIFHTFEMFSRRRHGVSLRPVVEGPTYEGKTNGTAPFINASAILAGEAPGGAGGRLHVFLTNRSLDAWGQVRVRLLDHTIAALDNGEILTGADPKAANSFERPAAVQPVPFDEAVITHGEATVNLPPLALAALTFRVN